MKLRFVKDTTGIYNHSFKKGEIIEYKPWNFIWKNMTEEERVKKGIFVFCYGQGEFNVFETEIEILKEQND